MPLPYLCGTSCLARKEKNLFKKLPSSLLSSVSVPPPPSSIIIVTLVQVTNIGRMSYVCVCIQSHIWRKWERETDFMQKFCKMHFTTANAAGSFKTSRLYPDGSMSGNEPSHTKHTTMYQVALWCLLLNTKALGNKICISWENTLIDCLLMLFVIFVNAAW